MGLENGLVTSFFQFFDLPEGVELSYVGNQAAEDQLEHFGGTFAPTLALEFDGATTRLVEELGPGVVVRTAAQTGEGDGDVTDDSGDTGSDDQTDSETTTPGDTDDQTDGGDQADAGDDTTPQGGVDAGFGGAASMLDDEGS
jgi:hypothetical protein